tara:strand:- start:3581 stop:5368 length:1788 start_codon:yes stop_codon:yes gene_type:complete
MSDIRNILNIINESEGDVKSNLPEANPGVTSDLVKTTAKFQGRSDGSNDGMSNDFEVMSLEDFLLDNGVEPNEDAEELAIKQQARADEPEDLEEFYVPPYDNNKKIRPANQRSSGRCEKCRGDGTILNPQRTDVMVCPECSGAGFFGDTQNRREPADTYTESLGKDGKEPAVKYRDSTQADLDQRIANASPPKRDKEEASSDEGEVARHLRHMRQLSGQSKIDEDDQIDEVLDAQSRKLGGKELTDYLDRILAKQKGKTDKYKLPYVHRSLVKDLIPIVDQEKNPYDLDKLAKDITVRPTKLLKQNEKMQHSDGTTSIFYNVGIPALTGLGYDEEKQEFAIVNTCPGAGECKTFCYALKGGYVQWRASSLSQTRILNYLWNDPDGFMEQLSTEIDRENRKADAKQSKHKVTIRWHDAGDFFSDKYLEMAYKLAAAHPTVDFYAYTKIADVAGSVQNRPPNFKINFSMGARRGEEKRVDFGITKHSSVVPKDIFNDLIQKDGNKIIKDKDGKIQWNSPEDWETFKERLANKYSINPQSIISYSEMMDMPLGRKDKGDNADGARSFKNDLWNVVVAPGDGDDSANRADVLGTYLLMH